MKRASLKSAKVPVLSATSVDVTDRLLKTEENRTPPAKLTPSPARKRSPRTAQSAPRSAPVSQPDFISQALTQTQLALTALQKARTESPAQYDLAVRYRLDALAHHLQQVADFIIRQAV